MFIPIVVTGNRIGIVLVDVIIVVTTVSLYHTIQQVISINNVDGIGNINGTHRVKCDFKALASTLFAVFCITPFLKRDVGYLLDSYVECLRLFAFLCNTCDTKKRVI